LSKLESIFISAVIGPVMPVFCFLMGWWCSFRFVSNEIMFLIALIGFGIGCVVDIIISGRISKAYWWGKGSLAMIYLFYSVCVFGFFMGVPIFNLAVGALAGIFMGRRFFHLGVERERLRKAAAEFAIFASSIMALISLASAYFATKDIRDTALNLKGMLNLPFVPTDPMIIVLIVVGGIGLILTQYWISKALAHWAYGKGNKVQGVSDRKVS